MSSFASVYAALLAFWAGLSMMVIHQTSEAQYKSFDRLPSFINRKFLKCFALQQSVISGAYTTLLISFSILVTEVASGRSSRRKMFTILWLFISILILRTPNLSMSRGNLGTFSCLASGNIEQVSARGSSRGLLCAMLCLLNPNFDHSLSKLLRLSPRCRRMFPVV